MTPEQQEAYVEIANMTTAEAQIGYAMLLGHVRTMFDKLPENRTIGMIYRYADAFGDDSREGPMVSALRGMAGK